MQIFLRAILFPSAWSVLLSCRQLLFCFNLACCLSDSLFSSFSWSLFFWLRLYLVLWRLFSLSRPSSLSLRLLSFWLRLLFVHPWLFSSAPLLHTLSLVCGSLLRLLVPASSRFLPSPLIRVGVPLLPSYFSFSSLPALS